MVNLLCLFTPTPILSHYFFFTLVADKVSNDTPGSLAR
jgi:hypothetical protein